MQREGSPCSEFTVSSVVCACAAKGDVFFCRQLHAFAIKAVVDADVFVGTALIDVYAKCGSIEEASCVFEGMTERNDVTWSSIVAGFVQNELYEEGLVLFARGKEMGLENNQFMISSVIRACAGLAALIEGRQVHAIVCRTGFGPNNFVVSALVDMGGLVHEAHELMTKMPFAAAASMWGSLLASCRIHGNLELAEIAAKNLFEMEPDRGGNYVLLANTYAASKKWEEAANARKSLKGSEILKERGKSWIEIKDKVHTFMAGERTHPRITDIYLELNNLLEEMTKLVNEAETDFDLHDLSSSSSSLLAKMGRVRTKTVKKSSRQVIERYYSKMTLDFHTNKKILEEVAIIPSKRLRNKIAGFSTHLMKRIQKGPVRGISLKLQEEERERRMDFVPEESAIKIHEIKVDKETIDMLAALGMSDVPGLVEVEPQPMIPTQGFGRGGGARSVCYGYYPQWVFKYVNTLHFNFISHHYSGESVICSSLDFIKQAVEPPMFNGDSHAICSLQACAAAE
ncbi:hypothetical protein D5086_020994 [Populus alba]|uniref:Uncharacterized protein n=1 Tax=Populus alba TaxID=43335 RepID=A0ACC4BMA4_POPAL